MARLTLSDVFGVVQENTGRINDLSATVAKNATETSARFDRVEGRLDGIQSSVDQLTPPPPVAPPAPVTSPPPVGQDNGGGLRTILLVALLVLGLITLALVGWGLVTRDNGDTFNDVVINANGGSPTTIDGGNGEAIGNGLPAVCNLPVAQDGNYQFLAYMAPAGHNYFGADSGVTNAADALEDFWHDVRVDPARLAAYAEPMASIERHRQLTQSYLNDRSLWQASYTSFCSHMQNGLASVEMASYTSYYRTQTFVRGSNPSVIPSLKQVRVRRENFPVLEFLYKDGSVRRFNRLCDWQVIHEVETPDTREPIGPPVTTTTTTAATTTSTTEATTTSTTEATTTSTTVPKEAKDPCASPVNQPNWCGEPITDDPRDDPSGTQPPRPSTTTTTRAPGDDTSDSGSGAVSTTTPPTTEAPAPAPPTTASPGSTIPPP